MQRRRREHGLLIPIERHRRHPVAVAKDTQLVREEAREIGEVDDLVIVIRGQKVDDGLLHEQEVTAIDGDEVRGGARQVLGAVGGQIAVEIEPKVASDGDRQQVPIEVEAEHLFGPAAPEVREIRARVDELSVAEAAAAIELVATRAEPEPDQTEEQRRGPHGSTTSTESVMGASRPASSTIERRASPTLRPRATN